MIESTLEKIRTIVPLIRTEAAAGERLGTLTPPVDQALKDLGLLTLLLPRRCGGAAMSLTDYARVHLELAKGDLSACWVVYATNAACWLVSTGSDTIQEAVFGAGPKVVCGATYPFGTGQEVDAGYVVNGAWNYMSGSRQADWMWGAVSITDRNGAKVSGKASALLPMTDVEIAKTWDVTGLQATGSDTVVAREVFVPRVRMVLPDEKFGTWGRATRHPPTPLDRIGTRAGVRVSGLGQLVGGAQTMLEILHESADGGAPAWWQPSSRAHSLEKAGAQIDMARALLFDVCGVLDQVGSGSVKLSMAEMARHKALCGQIAELVLEAVESVMFVAGSAAFALANPLNRYWRDIHMGLRHNNHLFFGAYDSSGQDRVASWAYPGALAT